MGRKFSVNFPSCPWVSSVREREAERREILLQCESTVTAFLSSSRKGKEGVLGSVWGEEGAGQESQHTLLAVSMVTQLGKLRACHMCCARGLSD